MLFTLFQWNKFTHYHLICSETGRGQQDSPVNWWEFSFLGELFYCSAPSVTVAPPSLMKARAKYCNQIK